MRPLDDYKGAGCGDTGLPSPVDRDSLPAGEARDLVDGLLDRFPRLHDRDRFVTPREARRLLDRNRDRRIDLTDWRRIASPGYPISRRGFRSLAYRLWGALRQPINLSFHPALNPEGGGTVFRVSHPLFEAIDRSGADSPLDFARLRETPKADLHLHLGGNASIRFLYRQALDRVGAGALNPDRWGGRLNWDSDSSYTNYRNFRRETLDQVIREVKAGVEMPEADFIAPSRVIAQGQEIERHLAESALTPEDRERLKRERTTNFFRFQQLALYRPLGRPASLADFLNVYRFASSLVERTSSLEALAAAVEDAMRNLSEDGVRYAEIRIGAPSLGHSTATAPERLEQIYRAAERTFTAAVQAIQETNRKLIREGKDPADLRIIFTLSKGASRSDENLLQTRALIRLLRSRPEFIRWIVGIDGASKEPGEPPSLYVPHLALIHEYNGSVFPSQRLGITWHQGEDFSDTSLFGAIRRVGEIVSMGIDRLGHGLVLGLDPALYLGRRFEMTLAEYAEQLRYEGDCPFAAPVHRFVDGALPDREDELAWVESLLQDRSAASITVGGRYPAAGTPEAGLFITGIRERQRFVLGELKVRGVVIEVNPTSNLFMALSSGRLEDHPLPFFRAEGVRVTINTDDAGIFGTDLNRELVGASLLLGGLTEAELVRLIREGFDSSFAVRVRGETLAHLQ